MSERPTLGVLVAAFVAVLPAACGGNVAVGSGGGGTTTTPSSSSSSGGTGGNGSVCGGMTAAKCAPGFFCDYAANTCNPGDVTGTCKPSPQGCEDIYAPVCGCDGVVYGNECSANAAGVDVNDVGTCPPPAGYFPCGGKFCITAMFYCQDLASDVGNIPSTYSCEALPSTCTGGQETCACLAPVMCGAICLPIEGGGLKVTCPGG